MAKKGTISMLSLFQVVPIGKLKFLTPVDQLKDILLEQPLKPENSSDNAIDPNACLIEKHHDIKKKSNQGLQFKKEGKQNQDKPKVYKKGPFAEFYENNEKVFDKDDEAWYYKEGKQIIGPVSSYNMDKMVYHKTITGQTRVAFKSIDKFVKFAKIQKALEDAKGSDHEQHQDTAHTSEHSHHHSGHHHHEAPKEHQKNTSEESPKKPPTHQAQKPVSAECKQKPS